MTEHPPIRQRSIRPRRLIAEDIDAYLEVQHQNKTLLRFITCGSVDDGKSTLIGRLLYDSKMIFEDQLAALEADSASASVHRGRRSISRCSSTGLPPSASRASQSTSPTASSIDRETQVHRRRYARPRAIYTQHGDRRFDRRSCRDPDRCAQGRAYPDTASHSYLAHLIGIRNLVLAVNKMDLIGYDQARYDDDRRGLSALSRSASVSSDFTAMPISGFKGDNITTLSAPTRHGMTDRR